jgi:hypothetical protein
VEVSRRIGSPRLRLARRRAREAFPCAGTVGLSLASDGLLLHTLDARGIVGAHVNVTYLCSVSLLVDGCFFFCWKIMA